MEEWPTVGFGDVVQKMNGKIGLDDRAGKLCVRGGHVPREFPPAVEHIVAGGEYLGPAFHRTFESADVLFTSRVPQKVGVPNFAGICSNTTLVLRTKSETLMQEFLPLVMETQPFQRHLQENNRGSTNPFINWTQLADYQFRLPPIETQFKIVQIVSQLDKLIIAQQDMKTWLDITRNIAISSLLKINQKTRRLNKLPSDWQWKKIEDVGEVKGGRQRSPKHAKGENMVQYLRVENVRDGTISYEDVLEMNFSEKEFRTYTLQKGDLLLVEGHANAMEVGRSSLFDGDEQKYCFQNTVVRIRADRNIVFPDFLHIVIDEMRRRQLLLGIVYGTSINHLGSSRLAQIKVPIAPLTTQKSIITDYKKYQSVSRQVSEHETKLLDMRSQIIASMLTTQPEKEMS